MEYQVSRSNVLLRRHGTAQPFLAAVGFTVTVSRPLKRTSRVPPMRVLRELRCIPLHRFRQEGNHLESNVLYRRLRVRKLNARGKV